jgi:hypothetical protein
LVRMQLRWQPRDLPRQHCGEGRLQHGQGLRGGETPHGAAADV